MHEAASFRKFAFKVKYHMLLRVTTHTCIRLSCRFNFVETTALFLQFHSSYISTFFASHFQFVPPLYQSNSLYKLPRFDHKALSRNFSFFTCTGHTSFPPWASYSGYKLNLNRTERFLFIIHLNRLLLNMLLRYLTALPVNIEEYFHFTTSFSRICA